MEMISSIETDDKNGFHCRSVGMLIHSRSLRLLALLLLQLS